MNRYKRCWLALAFLALVLSLGNMSFAGDNGNTVQTTKPDKENIEGVPVSVPPERMNSFCKSCNSILKKMNEGKIKTKDNEDWQVLVKMLGQAAVMFPRGFAVGDNHPAPNLLEEKKPSNLANQKANQNNTTKLETANPKVATWSWPEFVLSGVALVIEACILFIVGLLFFGKQKLARDWKDLLEQEKYTQDMIDRLKDSIRGVPLNVSLHSGTRDFIEKLMTKIGGRHQGGATGGALPSFGPVGELQHVASQQIEKVIKEALRTLPEQIDSVLAPWQNEQIEQIEQMKGKLIQLSEAIPSEPLSQLEKDLRVIQSTDLMELKKTLVDAIKNAEELGTEPEKLVDRMTGMLANDQQLFSMMVKQVQNAIGPVFAKEVNAIRLDVSIVDRYLSDWFGGKSQLLTELDEWKSFEWLGVDMSLQKIEWLVRPIADSLKSGSIGTAYLYPKKSSIPAACRIFSEEKFYGKFQTKESFSLAIVRPAIIQGVFYFDAIHPNEYKGYAEIVLPGVIMKES